MSIVEYQREWSPEVTEASDLIFRCSLGLLLISHLSSGKVLTALNLNKSIKEIKNIYLAEGL